MPFCQLQIKFSSQVRSEFRSTYYSRIQLSSHKGKLKQTGLYKYKNIDWQQAMGVPVQTSAKYWVIRLLGPKHDSIMQIYTKLKLTLIQAYVLSLRIKSMNMNIICES